MRRLLEWTPVGSVFVLADWLLALRHPAGWTGALIGLVLWGVDTQINGRGEDWPVDALVSAFLGTLWWIGVALGRHNRQGRPILVSGLLLGSFMGWAGWYDGDLGVYRGALAGIGFGCFLGGTLPTVWLRFRGYLYGLQQRHRFGLALALPLVRLDKEDHWDRLVADCYPFEARLILERHWQIAGTPQLLQHLHWLIWDGEQSLLHDYFEGHSELTDEQAEFVEQNRAQLEAANSIAAWDVAQAVLLIRWGAVAGHLSIREASQRLLDVRQRALALYSSWADYSDHFILGARFVRGGSHPEVEQSAHWCQDGQFRPWSRTPWA